MRYRLVCVLLWSVTQVCAHARSPGFRSTTLDTLLGQLAGGGRERGLTLIDRALLRAAPGADPHLIYFLRRYRCEQLYYQGLLDESMVEGEKARRIATELKDSILIASSLNQVAVLLEEQREDAKAIAMLEEALRWYPRTNPYTYPLATPHRIHGNLGLCWANLGRPDSARVHQLRSLELARKAGIPRGEALALLELGRLARGRSHTDSALVLFDRSVAVATRHKIHDVLLDGLAARAEAGIADEHVVEALASFADGHAVMEADSTIAPRSVVAFLQVEMRSLASVHRFQDALTVGRAWRALDRSIRTSGARTAQRNLQEMHATDAALADEHDRALISAAELEAEERIRTILVVGSIIVASLLATLIAVFIARMRQKARLDRLSLLKADQEQQIADLRIRQQVAEDLHDDLGAGLSALKLNSELAADLSTDPRDQRHARSLAAIAGNLIGNMRHILWSLGPGEGTIAELTTYIADRARAYCAEHELSITIHDPGGWPEQLADAEVRHIAWPVLRDTLQALISAGADALVLDLRWKEGLLVGLQAGQGAEADLRIRLAERIADHQLQVSRCGGWLRTATDGSPRIDLFLPCPARTADLRSSACTATTAMLLFLVGLCPPSYGQSPATYHHALLDSLFPSLQQQVSAAERIRAINTALARPGPDGDGQLAYHLLMARAKEMYYQGLYDRGIADVNRSLELATAVNDSLLIATAYNMFGLLNENLGDDAVTLPWFRTAERWLPRSTECPYPVVKDYHIHGNIAQCLLNLGRHDSAAFHFRRSLQQAQQAGNLRAQALANLGLAGTALAMGDPAQVAALVDSAQAQALRCGSTDVFVDAFPVKARALLRTRGRDAAVHALDDAEVYLASNSAINRSSVRRYFEQAALLREELGQFEAAYTAWMAWQRLDSAIRATDDQAAVASIRLMLDNEERLRSERAFREQAQAQLAIDRSLRSTIVSASGITALLLLGLFALLVKRQRDQRQLAALELERLQGRTELAQLRVRHRLNEDMLMELGTGLEALRIRSALSSSLEQQPEARERMARIAALATELSTGLKHIVWALDSGRSSLAETVRFTTHYASTYTAQHGLVLHADVPADIPDRLLSMEQRRNIFLVVKEALHNVVKHAQATEVELRIRCGEAIEVHLADNGQGMADAQGHKAGNGLRNMRKRIEAIGGRFEMRSENGTAIEITVPLPDNNGSTPAQAT